MNAYVWDRGCPGAYVIVAESAQAAADLWNQRYPDGLRSRTATILHATAESFTEVKPGEVFVTDGDC